jgi:hypothetical protein
MRRVSVWSRALSTGSKHYVKPLKTKQKGIDILHDPLWNKGLAFGVEERDRLNLRGLLPPRVKDLTEQAKKAMNTIREFGDDNVRKNMFLQELHNRNETLYHRLLVDNIREVAPLVYTPTVGVSAAALEPAPRPRLLPNEWEVQLIEDLTL